MPLRCMPSFGPAFMNYELIIKAKKNTLKI